MKKLRHCHPMYTVTPSRFGTKLQILENPTEFKSFRHILSPLKDNLSFHIPA